MGRDVPGQKYFLVLLSLCPGTRPGAKIPGQTPLSRDVLGQNHFPPKKKPGKRYSKTGTDVLKQEIIGKNSVGPSRQASRPGF